MRPASRWPWKTRIQIGPIPAPSSQFHEQQPVATWKNPFFLYFLMIYFIPLMKEKLVYKKEEKMRKCFHVSLLISAGPGPASKYWALSFARRAWPSQSVRATCFSHDLSPSGGCYRLDTPIITTIFCVQNTHVLLHVSRNNRSGLNRGRGSITGWSRYADFD